MSPILERSSIREVPAHSSYSAGNLPSPAGAINTAKGCAVRCRVPCDIEICCFAGFLRKLRLRQEGKACYRVERRFCFVPLDTRVFDPEGGVQMLAPIGHPFGVEKLDSKVEAAHLAIFVDVPDQLVLQAVRVTPLQRARRIARERSQRLLYYVDRSVAKRYGAPVAQLLIRLDRLVCLQLCQREGSQHFQLVIERKGPQAGGRVRCRKSLHGRQKCSRVVYRQSRRVLH